MSCGNPIKHSKEKTNPTPTNCNLFPFEKEGVVSFYRDPLDPTDYENECMQFGICTPID